MALALHHAELCVADKGERIGIPEIRKHIAWYLRGMNGEEAWLSVDKYLDEAIFHGIAPIINKNKKVAIRIRIFLFSDSGRCIAVCCFVILLCPWMCLIVNLFHAFRTDMSINLSST